MKNLIYLVIGLIWVAYSLYTARQKALQKQQPSGMPPRGPSTSSPLPIPGNQGGGKSLLEDIFREITGEARPVPQISRNESIPVPVTYPQKKSSGEPPKRSTAYISIPNIPTDFPRNESENIRKTHVLHEQLTKDESISKKFDLREAVIFSELLNRKYF